MVFFLAFCNLTPCLCNAKEDANSTRQNSKPKTSATEKNTTKNNTKSENKNKNDNDSKVKDSSEKNTNNTDDETPKNEEPSPDNKNTENKSPVPKMNSILTEGSNTNKQKETPPDENKTAESPEPEYNLPEISNSELENVSPTSALPEAEPEPRDVPKTILAWVLMGAGAAIIIVTIILNLKIPRDTNFRYHEKHKAKKIKNRYNLKYK